MGLGGLLMWTAAARAVIKNSGHPDLKILPIESTSNSNIVKVINSEVFINNDDFVLSQGTGNYLTFPIVLNDPRTNYCKSDTPERAIHRHDRHVIQQICENYGILNPELKCVLKFTDTEFFKAADFLVKVEHSENRFIVIEPNVKNEYGINKEYPLDKWQRVVDSFPDEKFIQVGTERSKRLSNVIDLCGKTTFREAAQIIGMSKLFVGSEGGLMHASNAVNTQAVIIVTGFLHPTMTCYPENDNIWIGADHGPCGMKIKCDKCNSNAVLHDPDEIVQAIRRRI